jgi:methionyl aminopeptidase
MSQDLDINPHAKPKLTLKDAKAQKQMQALGKIAAEIIKEIEKTLKAGITTEDVNKTAEKLMRQKKVKSSLKSELKFPKSISTSVNNVIASGVPSDSQKLESGDILKINLVLSEDKESKDNKDNKDKNYLIETTKSFVIENGSLLTNRLMQTAKEVTEQALKAIKPNAKIGDIGHQIQKYMAKNKNFSVVKDLCGHGIGESYCEDTYQIKNEGTQGLGMSLQPGMTFTVEPVVTAGKQSIITQDDNSIATKDKSLSALFAHTVLVTENGMICLSA